MKRIALWILCLLFAAPTAFGASSEYLYRQRLNWVKVKKASPKEVPLGTFKHPVQMTAETVEAMLLSVKINNKFLLKKEIETDEIFNSWEARKLAPFIAQGLAEADADHVVNFAVVHKRPTFVIRNDHLSMGNIWYAEDGLHIQFNKLFAKLDGDYEASSQMDKAINRAKSVRVTLASGEGQKLSYDSPTEIILNPGHDFHAQVAAAQAEELKQEEQKLKGKKRGKQSDVPEIAPAPSPAAVPVASGAKSAPTVSTSASTAERLKEIDQLKADKLITQEEYNQLRKKVLSDF